MDANARGIGDLGAGLIAVVIGVLAAAAATWGSMDAFYNSGLPADSRSMIYVSVTSFVLGLGLLAIPRCRRLGAGMMAGSVIGLVIVTVVALLLLLTNLS